MATYAIFNYQFDKIIERARQGEFEGMESVVMTADGGGGRESGDCYVRKKINDQKTITTMKKQILFLAMMLLPMVAGAQGVVEIDGIYYELVSKIKEATVIKKNSGSYYGNVVIPASVSYEGVEYSVTSIGSSAFYYSGLTSITIPNSVTSIGSNAFSQCYSLTAVHISDIDAWCKISFDDNPLWYAHHLYFGEEEIRDLVIPNSVTSIGSNAFYGCSGLTSVTIPNSVTSIESFAFADCSGLTSVTIGSGVTILKGATFYGCRSLTTVTIPNSVTKIEDGYSLNGKLYGVFHNCSSLTTITIPNSVTHIGSWAFKNCSGLTSVTIPNCLTSIGESAFSSCSGLTSVTIPNSVSKIGIYAFNQCSGLTSVTIPNSVTSIEDGTFYDCSGLTSVTIPNSATNIGGSAFASCKDLMDVYCLAEEVPSTNTDAFQDSYIEYATLHVPTASIDAYKAVEPWKSFKTIMGLDGTIVETQKCATPTISYGGKRLTFSCETEDVEYVYEIKDSDIKKGYDSEVQLSATYEISVYATKTGWENSDIATATLVWGNATFTETTPEPSSIPSLTFDTPALITAHGGVITVKTEADGIPVAVYTIDGQLYGSSSVSNSQATISTNLQSGSIAIVKIGQKAVKVVVK